MSRLRTKGLTQGDPDSRSTMKQLDEAHWRTKEIPDETGGFVKIRWHKANQALQVSEDDGKTWTDA